jgi:hypothetical protein
VTLQEAIDEARKLLQDTNTSADLQRFSDADLTGYGNQVLKRMALMRPDLFAYMGTVACTENEILQSAPSDSIRLFEVFRIQDGNALREVNRETMDQTYPAWRTTTAAAATAWMRHPRNQNKFFIYPQAPADQTLIVEYAQSPSDYAIGDTIALLSDSYLPALIDGIVWLAESIDNEHVTSQRAQMFQQSFVQQLQANMESRMVTDNERGGLDKKDER